MSDMSEAMRAEIGQKVRNFVMTSTRLRELRDDDEIFRRGVVNSLLATQLVMFVEKEFGIRVKGSDLNIANFSSVKRIAEFVGSKLSSR